MYCSKYIDVQIAALAILAISCWLPASALGQTQLSSDTVIQNNFTGFESSIGTQSGVPTQMAFDPNDPDHLYVATWQQGIQRYDYTETGTLTNGTQVIAATVNLGENGTNGSYGIAFHDDPVLGSVMYLSRSMPNTPITPRGPGLGSIVRVTDSNGDGTWGGAGDVNQTIVDDIYVADWTHQINQFAIHGDTLYVGIGTMTNNGGIINSIGDSRDPGESAQSGSILFIEDLTVHSNDTTSTNAAWFNIGDDLSDPADVVAFKSDSNAFSSSDPGKFRVFATGLRNCYGVAVNPEGQLWVSNNQGGESPATDNLDDEVFQTNYKDDHQFPKANDVVGDWKAPGNTNVSAQIAQAAGFFQTMVAPHATLGNGTAVTGLTFVNAPNNDFDDHVVLARHSNGGQDVVLVDPVTGSVQQLLTRENGRRPTDVVTDPFGNFLVCYSTSQIARIRVDGLSGGGGTDPGGGGGGGDPAYSGESIGIDFASPNPAFGTDPSADPSAGTNFNAFDVQTADGATASFAGTLINLEGDPTAVGFSVTNNMGKASGLTGVTGATGPAPFDDLTIAADIYGAANVGNSSRADFGTLDADANLVFTFSGLDDSLLYQVTGGYLQDAPNNNFNSTWESGGQSATTANTSGAANAGYITLAGLSTDGSGNLEITVTKSVQLFVAGVTLTASSPPLPTDIGVLDDFEDSTHQGWGNGGNSGTGAVTMTTNLPDAGPAGIGDMALDVEFGNRAVILNSDARWTGSYTAAGVQAVRLDINNTGNNTVDLRIGIRGPDAGTGGAGGSWVTAAQSVAPGSGWTTLIFPMTESDLINTDQFGGAGFSAAVALADVQQIRLIDNNDPFDLFRGRTDSDGFILDNIGTLIAPTALKGDVDLSGVVDFADIPAFISVLQTGDYQAEADVNCDGAVDFGDIPPFIQILIQQ